ncbi:hypothetical protein [Vibrio coralliirubri]|uniref:hypothetical protein n=1 Tax=Vibrio coralliirubri TaxID=1516159 RepID=UPI00073E8BE1|nr:hypothetical protein [Vibrio coralliirubri]
MKALISTLVAVTALAGCSSNTNSTPKGMEHLNPDYTAEEYETFSTKDKKDLVYYWKDERAARELSKSKNVTFGYRMLSKYTLYKLGDVEAGAEIVSIALILKSSEWSSKRDEILTDPEWINAEFENKDILTRQISAFDVPISGNVHERYKLLCEMYTTEDGIYAFDEVLEAVALHGSYYMEPIRDIGYRERYNTFLENTCGNAYQATKDFQYIEMFVAFYDKFESKLQYDFRSLPSGIIGFQNIDLPNKEHAALYEKYPETTGKFFYVWTAEEIKGREARIQYQIKRMKERKAREQKVQEQRLVETSIEEKNVQKLTQDQVMFNDAWVLLGQAPWFRADQSKIVSLFRSSAALGNDKAQYNVNEFLRYFNECTSSSMGLHCSQQTPPPKFIK